LTARRLPAAIGVPGDWESLFVRVVVVCVCEVLGPAEAPPDGLADVVVEVVGGAGAWDDVVVLDGVLAVEVVAAEEEEEVVVVAGEVWAAPLDEVVEAEPPQPATIRISVSAARA
jgi:hypothetical protein